MAEMKLHLVVTQAYVWRSLQLGSSPFPQGRQWKADRHLWGLAVMTIVMAAASSWAGGGGKWWWWWWGGAALRTRSPSPAVDSSVEFRKISSVPPESEGCPSSANSMWNYTLPTFCT